VFIHYPILDNQSQVMRGKGGYVVVRFT